MATATRKVKKSGQVYYEIRSHVSRDRPTLTTRWDVPDGWSQTAIDRTLEKKKAEFDRQVRAGEVLSRKERKEKAAAEAEEAARIQTVKDFGEKVFMPSLTITCSENTRNSFQGNLGNHIYPAIGALKMPDVTPAQINALLLKYQASGKAHASCVKLYTILNLLFKKAYMQDVIDRNPMDKVDRPKSTKAESKDNKIEAYTDEETNYILDCLQAEPLKWRVFVNLLIDTGMRRGECCALRWSSIDFDECSIKITSTLNYTPEKGVFENTPKSGKSRTVYIDPEIKKMLEDLKGTQKAPAVTDVKSPPPGYVFSDDGVTPMHPTTPTHYFKQFEKRHGVEHFHPHKLRHTFASSAILNGSDIASVSEVLGHADKSTTLRMYTHADAEAQKKAAENRRQALKEKRKQAQKKTGLA